MKYYNSEMAVAIAECVHSERDRFVLQRNYLDDWTIEAIAEHPKVDRTPRQISNVIDKYNDELFEFIRNERARRGQ